jgi:hypothetical protein
MSAMQDFYIAPVSVEAAIAKAQADRSLLLAAMIRSLPAKCSRLVASLQVSREADATANS